MKVVTRSVEETRALGEELGRDVLVAGDVVVLTGELGTGKTALAQGVGRGLAVDGPVVSPTFTLVREYDGRVHPATSTCTAWTGYRRSMTSGSRSTSTRASR